METSISPGRAELANLVVMRDPFCRNNLQDGKIKGLAAKAFSLTHMVEGKSNSSKLASGFHIYPGIHACIHTHTENYII